MFAKALALAGLVVLLWSVAARPSGAHGHRVVYRVRPHDTLWAIAQARYGGDVRGAVWQIEQANHLRGTALQPGEALVLP